MSYTSSIILIRSSLVKPFANKVFSFLTFKIPYAILIRTSTKSDLREERDEMKKQPKFRRELLKFNQINKELNDIGNYGEVIRLQADSNPAAGLDKELIKINAEHQIELKQAADYTGNSNYGGDITLASKEGLALLAITWQTRGYFSADKTYIPTNSWTELTKKNISLSADIDLTGTGILGIERDSENTTAYTGTFYGNGKKITLAIGEQYGFRNKT